MSLEDFSASGEGTALAPAFEYDPEAPPEWIARPKSPKETADKFAIATSAMPENWAILVLKNAVQVSSGLEEVIEESRSILDMGDDWDGEGAAAYSEATWTRAVEFLRTGARQHVGVRGSLALVPRILPGPDGSVDLHWKHQNTELLVNIPADPAAPIDFYGDRGSRSIIKGKLDAAHDTSWIFQWLTK